jgi:hypothetical protein
MGWIAFQRLEHPDQVGHVGNALRDGKAVVCVAGHREGVAKTGEHLLHAAAAKVQLLLRDVDRPERRDVAMGIDNEVAVPDFRHADAKDRLSIQRVIALVALGADQVEQARARRLAGQRRQGANHQGDEKGSLQPAGQHAYPLIGHGTPLVPMQARASSTL